MTMRAMSVSSKRPARASLLLVAAFVAFAGFAIGPAAHPQPAAASTATYMEGLLVKWINSARSNRGLRPLTVGATLTELAGDRATTLAKTESLVHPDCLSCTFRSYRVSFSTCGEVIAYTTYPWGYEAARSIFRGWKSSSSHWAALMGKGFRRIGIGVAYRSSDHSTWAAGELAG